MNEQIPQKTNTGAEYNETSLNGCSVYSPDENGLKAQTTYQSKENEPHVYRKPPCVYNGTDRFFAALAFVLGFLVTKVVINVGSGLGLAATITFVLITLFNFFYSKRSGLSITVGRAAVYGLVLLLSLMFVITDNHSVKNIDFWLVISSNLYLVYSSYKVNNRSVIFDVFKSVFISPFHEYSGVFGAFFHRKTPCNDVEKKDKENQALPIIIGLLISAPVTVVIAAILLNGDDMFRALYGSIAEVLLDKLLLNVFIFACSLPVGMYIFGAVYSRAYKKLNERFLPKVPKTSMRICPAAMCNAFLTPLCILYVFYIFCQLSYFFKTVGNIETETFDYSSYAREGFFELCVVAVLNLGLTACVIFLVKYNEKKLPVTVRGFISVFSVLTLCLIATALTKMMLYIDIYGFTPLRVYTSVFMSYLFIMFIVMIIKQIKNVLSFTKFAYFLAAAVIVLMSVIPVDGLIIKKNLDLYDEGQIEWMGSSAIYQLDCSAVSFLEDYAKGSAEKSAEIQGYLEEKAENVYDFDVYSFNFTRFGAYLTLKEE